MMNKSLAEEKWNSITHAIMLGFFLSNCFSNYDSKIIYSVGMSVAMFFSVLYHASERINIKAWFRKLDMLSIHIAIAFSGLAYIVKYGDPLYVYPVSTVGVLGIVYTLHFFEKPYFEKWVPRSYMFFGLLTFVLTFVSIVSSTNLQNSYFFVAGIFIYLTGLLFYVKDMKEWNHMIWHIFVMLGSLIHFFGL